MGFFTNLFGKKSNKNKETSNNFNEEAKDKDASKIAPEMPISPIESTPEEGNSETPVITNETPDIEKEKINE